jgi:hypothetical protein
VDAAASVSNGRRQAARCFEWSGPYGEEFAPDKSASANYQAELLTAIVSGTSRRNVLGAIALKRTIATSRSDDNRDESKIKDRGIHCPGHEKKAITQSATVAQKPEEKPLPLDKLFQEGSFRGAGFVSELEIAASAGGSSQVVAEKAEKRNRRENYLSAVFVNCFGAIIPLPNQKLPRQNAVRNSLEEREIPVSAMR